MALDETINVVGVDNVMLELKLGEEKHATIERLVNVASRRLEKYCNTVFKAREITRVLNGPDFPLLDLGGPIISVTSVTVGVDVLSVDDYEVLNVRGQLYRSAGWSGGGSPITGVGGLNNVEVEAVLGYEPIPYEVVEAAIILIRGWVERPGSEGMQSERIGDYSYTRFNRDAATVSARGTMPEEVLDLLEPYVRHV